MSAVTYRMMGADEPNSVMDVEPHPLPQVSEPATIIKCAFAVAEEPPGFNMSMLRAGMRRAASIPRGPRSMPVDPHTSGRPPLCLPRRNVPTALYNHHTAA